MEGARFPVGERVKPEIRLNQTDFRFAKNLKIGDEGELDINGIVTRIRMTDDGDLFKSFQIITATPKLNKETRKL